MADFNIDDLPDLNQSNVFNVDELPDLTIKQKPSPPKPQQKKTVPISGGIPDFNAIAKQSITPNYQSKINPLKVVKGVGAPLDKKDIPIKVEQGAVSVPEKYLSPDTITKEQPQAEIPLPIIEQENLPLDELMTKGVDYTRGYLQSKKDATQLDFEKKSNTNNVVQSFNQEAEVYKKTADELKYYSDKYEKELGFKYGSDFIAKIKQEHDIVQSELSKFETYGKKRSAEAEKIKLELEKITQQYQSGEITNEQAQPAYSAKVAQIKAIEADLNGKQEQLLNKQDSFNAKLQDSDFQAYLDVNKKIEEVQQQSQSLITRPEFKEYRDLLDAGDKEQAKKDALKKAYQKSGLLAKVVDAVTFTSDLVSNPIGTVVDLVKGENKTFTGTRIIDEGDKLLARTLTAVASVPKMLENLNPIGSAEKYDFFDKLFDQTLEYSKKREILNPVASDVNRDIKMKFADVDGYKLLLDEKGEPKGDVRDADGYKVDENTKNKITEQYNTNPKLYKTDSDFSFSTLTTKTTPVLLDMGTMIAVTAATGGGSAAMVGTSAAQMYSSMYESGIQAGLKPGEANDFATLTSIMTGMVTLVNPMEANITKGIASKGIGKIFGNGITKADVQLIRSGKMTIGQLAKRVTKEGVKNTLGENLEELVLEPFVQKATETLYNNKAQKQGGGFETDWKFLQSKEDAETAMITTMTSLVLTPVEVSNSIPEQRRIALLRAFENPEQFLTQRNLLLNSGDISAEKFDYEIKAFEQISKQYNAVKDEISEEHLDDLAELLLKKYTIKNTISQVNDDVLNKKNKIVLQDIDAKLGELITGNYNKDVEQTISNIIENNAPIAEKQTIVLSGQEVTIVDDLEDGNVLVEIDNDIKEVPKEQLIEAINNEESNQDVLTGQGQVDIGNVEQGGENSTPIQQGDNAVTEGQIEQELPTEKVEEVVAEKPKLSRKERIRKLRDMPDEKVEEIQTPIEKTKETVNDSTEPTTKVNKSVSEVADNTEQQEIKEAVQPSVVEVGQGNAEGKSADVESEKRFTESKDMNRMYADLKSKHGDKKGTAIYQAADRLVNPNTNTIVEIRSNGVVVKEGDKYLMKPFGNTDANSKKWTLYKGIDVTEQYAKNQPISKTETNEQKSENNVNLAEDKAENELANSKLTDQDNVEQEPSIKVIESKAESNNEAELNEVVKKADELINNAIGIQRIPLSELSTDENRFQARDELNQDRVDDIANNFSDANQDPIHVWTDVKDGKTYVLSGHHRYYGAKKAGRTDVKIIDRTNDFTEKEAIKFATEEANANRSMETPLERANTLRKKRERGDSKEEVDSFLEKEGKNKSYTDNLSRLNPKGKAIQALKQLANSTDKVTQKETEKIADWIGDARKSINGLTDAHENEMFDFLMDKDMSKRITTKADFLQKVRSVVNPLLSEEPLNLQRFKNKTQGEQSYDEEVSDKKAEIAERQRQIDAINDRFSNPANPDYIKTSSTDYAQARKIADDKISKLDAERKALQKQLEDIYRNKGKYTSAPSTGSLFQSTDKSFTPIDKTAFEKLLDKLKKAFPNVKVELFGKNDFESAKKALEKWGVDVTQFLSVWHGSPHNFDKFSTDKMGTGEGAQAFGWGLYFTDLKEIASGYADKLTEHSIYVNGKEVDSLRGTPLYDVSLFIFGANNIAKEQGKESAISNLKQAIRDGRIDYNEATKAIKYLESLNSFSIKKDKRNLYKAKIHEGKAPEQYNWLEWDNEVTSENINKVINALKKEGKNVELNRIDGIGRMLKLSMKEANLRFKTGSDVYNALKNELGSDKEASLFLLENGIDGIKYPAESIARGVTSDNARGFNYVVFDENAVEIEEKIQFLRTPNGTIYGFKTPDGKVFINTDNLNANTPIHEYAHIWQSVFPEGFARGIELLKLSPQGQKLIAEIQKNPAYKGKSLAEIQAEALVTAIGNKGEQIFKGNPSALKRFQEWLTDFFKTIGDKLGLDTLSADDKLDMFTKKVVGELLGGKVLSKEVGSEINNSVKFQDSNYKATVAFEKWKGKNRLVSGADIQEIKSGEPVVVQGYHGTTNEFYVFDSTVKGNIEGHLGKVNYFTSDEQDASGNYQSDGADLTGRIDRRQEEIENTLEYEYSDDNGNIILSKVKDDFGITAKQLKELYPSGIPNDIKANELSRFIAEKELKGGTEKVLDVYIKLNNPIVLGDKSTWFETMNISESDINDATQEIADEYDISVEEAKNDYVFEIHDRAIENTGYEKLHIEALTDALNTNGYDGNMASEILGDDYYETEVDLNKLEKKLRKAELYENNNGEMASSQVIADFFKNLGYDGIILNDVSERFKNMGIGGGTSHIHVFDEFSNQIKLADGTNTTFNPESNDIRFQKIQDENLSELVDDAKADGLTLEEFKKELDDENADYDLGELTAIWGVEPPKIDGKTQTITSDGKVRDKALVNKAYNGEQRQEIRDELEKIGLTYDVENQESVVQKVNEMIEKYGIDALYEQIKNKPDKNATDAVIFDAKIRSVEEKMLTADEKEFVQLVEEQARLYEEMGAVGKDMGRYISMLGHIYRTSDLAYSYQRQVELYKKANNGKISAEMEVKFKDLYDDMKEAQDKIVILEKEKKEIEEKLSGSVSKEQADKHIKEAYEKGKKDGSVTKKARKKIEKANEKIAQGMQDFLQAIGGLSMAEGNTMPSVTKALKQIGEGLIEKGLATAENVFDKIVEYITSETGNKPDIEDYRSEFEKENKTSKSKTPALNGKIKDIVVSRREQGLDTTIDDVVEEIGKEYPDLSEREVRDEITGYGKTRESSQEPDDATVRKIKRMGRYLSALEDIENGIRPERSGQQRDSLDPEERKLLKEIREGLKKLPLTSADLTKKLKTAQDAIETRLKNRIEDLNRQITTGEKPIRNTKAQSTPEIDDLRQEVKDLQERLDIIQSANKHSDTLDELQDIADKTGTTNLTKQLVQDGLITDLLQSHIEKGTDIADVQDAMFNELQTIFPNITKSELRDAILRTGSFKADSKEMTDLRKKESELKKQLKLQEKIEKAEKGIVDVTKIKGAESDEVKRLKAELREAKAEALNKYPNISANELDKRIRATQKSIAEIERKTREGEFEKKKTVKKQFMNDPEWKKKFNELREEQIKKINAQTEFDKAQEQARMANREMGEKLKDFTLDILGMPKATVATLDLSAPLRQGIGLGISNPKEFGAAFGAMHRMLFSKKYFDKWMDGLKTRDDFYVISNSGLAITNPNGKAQAREDVFMNNLAKKIPIYGTLYSASERAYSGFLNKLRVDVFAKGADKLQASGITFEDNPEAYKALARVINNATGRGELWGAEKVARELGLVFFSPRMITSRVGMVTDLVRTDTPMPVKIMAAKNLVGFTGYLMTIHALAALAIAKINDDDDELTFDEFMKKMNINPVETDFLKSRQRKTRYDFSAGFASIIRLIARLIKGKAINSKGRKYDLWKKNKKGFNPTVGTELGTFLNNKLSPTGKVLWNWAYNEDMENFRKEFSKYEAVKSLIIPLNIRDAIGEENIKWEKKDFKGIPFEKPVGIKEGSDLDIHKGKYIMDRIMSLYGVSIMNY